MAVLGVLLWVGGVTQATAATDTWSATGTADWNTAANWSLTAVPGINDTATIMATDPGASLVLTYTAPMTAASIRVLTIGDNALSGSDTATLNISASGFNVALQAILQGKSIVNVNSGGVLNIGSSGLVMGNYNTASSAFLTVATGGSLTVTGGTTINEGTLTLGDSSTLGAVSLSGVGAAATLSITGGTNTLGAVTDTRDSGAQTTASGILVSGGTTTATSLTLANAGSWGNMLVSGGSFTVNGAFVVGANTSNNARGGSLKVTGGTLTDLDTTTGLVLASGTGSTTLANALPGIVALSGGTTTFGKITLIDSTVGSNYATATLGLSGGSLYVGSGGIITNANGTTTTAAVNLSGGTLGATADWSSSVPMTVTGTAFTIQAADASNVAHNITLSGVLSGAGALTKTGGGKLTLSGANTYTGATAVSAGTLAVNGSLANTAVTVASGAVLQGTGSVAGLTTVTSGGILVAGDGATTGTTLTLSNGITTNSGGTLEFALDAANAHSTLALSSGGTNTFSSGTAVTFLNIQAGTYDNIITGLSGNSTEASWTLTNAGYSAVFTFDGSNIDATVTALAVPEPHVGLLFLGGATLLVLRRSRAAGFLRALI